MVVDDLDDLGLFDAKRRLARLVVIDQDNPALGALRDVGTRDDANAEAILVKHHRLTKRACHEVLYGVLEQTLAVKLQHVALDKLVDLLTERLNEVSRHRHGVCPLFQAIGRGDVAVGDGTRGYEPSVGAVFVSDHKRANVLLT